LPGMPPASPETGRESPATSRAVAPVVPPPSKVTAAPSPASPPRAFDDARQALADQLSAEVEAALATGGRLGLPLGKWLARDAVLVAYEHAGSVASRAAAALGVPETTFSRHLAQAEAEAASVRKPESWATVRLALADLLRATGRPPGNLVDHLEDLLLEIVVARVAGNTTQAAGLMGVSVPTIKRRLSQAKDTDRTLVGSV